MAISIRAEETRAIVEALESEYASDKAAAKAVLQLCFDLLSERELQAVVVHWGTTTVVFGPYDGLTAAKTAARLAASVCASGATETLVRIIPLVSPASLSESPTGLPGGTSGCVCGHAWPAHMDRQWKNWRKGVKDWSAEPWRKPGCMHCTCRETWSQPVRRSA